MKKYFILVVIAVCQLVSCAVTNKEPRKVPENIALQNLLPLPFYKSSDDYDTGNSKRIIFYNKLGLSLKEEIKNHKFTFTHNDEILYSNNYDDYIFQFEIFDATFLVISYIKPQALGASSYESFDRDSMVIIDLKRNVANRTSLKNIRLHISSWVVKNNKLKGVATEEWLRDKSKLRYCAIDRIDLAQHKIFICNPALEIEAYETFDVK